MPTTPEVWRPTQLVNTVTAGAQYDSQITQLENGNILVTWTSSEDTGAGSSTGPDVLGQLYDPLGNAIGSEFLVSLFSGDADESAVAATRQGDAIVAYITDDGTTSRVRYEIFDETGSNTGFDTVATVTTTNGYRDPQVAVSSTTSAIIVYVENNADDRLLFRTLNPSNGTLGTETLLYQNVSGGGFLGDTDITVLNNGNYVVTSTFGDGADDRIAYRIVSPAGNYVSNLLYAGTTDTNGLDDNDPTVAALSGGGFVIAWTSTDTNDRDLQFQVFNAAGANTTGVVTVNGGATTDDNNEPQLVALNDGGFILFWDDDETGNLEISGQRYNAAGTAVGTTFTVSAGVNQIDATLLDDGRVAVTWTLNNEIRMKIVDTRDAPTTGDYNPDWQIGTIGNDTFTADATSATVHGWDGNDVITQAGTVRSYFGGDGNDYFYVTSPINSDLHDGGAGNDTINFDNGSLTDLTIDLAGGTVTRAAASETMVGFENAIASDGNDSVIGTTGSNILWGQDGSDTLSGSSGNDTLYGGVGDDSLLGGNNDDYLSGSTGNDTLIGGSGSDSLYGGSDDDSLDGGSGTDTLYGQSGNDTLTSDGDNGYYNGGSGDDLMYSGLGNETMDGATGNDTIDHSAYNGDYEFDMTTGETFNASGTQFAGESFVNFENAVMGNGDDTVEGTSLANGILGGGGNDSLLGMAGADTIIGGDGNDTILGGTGSDSVHGQAGDDLIWVQSGDGLDDADGGTGNDTLSYFDVSGDIVFNMIAGTLQYNGGSTVTSANFENYGDGSGDSSITGTAGANVIAGNDGDDTIFGYGGDDNILGGGDNDELRGNVGNDTLIGGAGSDTIFGGENDDLLGGDSGNDVLDGGTGNDGAYGGAGNDLIVGSAGDDTLNGGDGYDTADYSAAADNLVVNINFGGAQAISASMGSDVLAGIEGIEGGTANDLLVGNAGGNILNGNAGSDELYGLAGADVLNGGAGNDLIEGSGGNDTMDGGAGIDTLNYYNAAGGVTVNLNIQGTAQAVGGSMGTDLFANFENLIGSNGFADVLVGDGSGNAIYGQGGNDTIYGGGGNDTLYGMQGDDAFAGGGGADLMIGGGGNDFFDFNAIGESAPGTRDTIQDFGVGDDIISLETIDANTTVGGNQAFVYIGSNAFTDAGQVRFVTNGTDGFLLANVDAGLGADFEVRLLGVTALPAVDLIL